MIWDIFSGNHGSQAQGDPSSAGAGDGVKAQQITDFLSSITGVYEAVTGQGEAGSPAPAPQAVKPGGPNYLLIGGVVIAVLALFLFLKKR
jgi:hypothetical protein